MKRDGEGKLTGILQTIGPGILFAGAAIGGSHLVQSTRAGASYGFTLIWIVVLVLLFKYPFFEFSHRYTAATGESLLAGYRRLGRAALGLFLVIAATAAVINAAAVTLVTAALAGQLIGRDISIVTLSLLVLLVVGFVLLIGRYRTLDTLMKFMVVVLGIATVAAVAIAFAHGPAGAPDHERPAIWTLAGLSFLLALMGWMPAPIDVAVWPSLWALERSKQTRHRPKVREALIDFHLGYVATSILAVAFVCLGALVMFGTGESFSNSGVVFSGQLIDLYTQTLGGWSRWLIALVAFITMSSTTLAVFDGYTRTLKGTFELMWPRAFREGNKLFWIILPVQMAVALAVIAFFMQGIKTMMDVATILAFLTAPFLAVLNYRVVNSDWVPAEHRPRAILRILAWLGVVYLTGFCLVYLYWRLL